MLTKREENRTLAKVCPNLARVCDLLAKDTKENKYIKEFESRAKTFRAFGKLFRR